MICYQKRCWSQFLCQLMWNISNTFAISLAICVCQACLVSLPPPPLPPPLIQRLVIFIAVFHMNLYKNINQEYPVKFTRLCFKKFYYHSCWKCKLKLYTNPDASTVLMVLTIHITSSCIRDYCMGMTFE